jgi:hypothetical protein
MVTIGDDQGAHLSHIPLNEDDGRKRDCPAHTMRSPILIPLRLAGYRYVGSSTISGRRRVHLRRVLMSVRADCVVRRFLHPNSGAMLAGKWHRNGHE